MIKVLQFGEGNFLRAFVDYYFDIAKTNNDFVGSIAVCQPRTNSTIINALKMQNGRYNVLLKGKLNGKIIDSVRPISCIGEVIDSTTELEKIKSLFKSNDLSIIVSNTTEAGICYSSNDSFDDYFNISFPAKITSLLYSRFKAGLNGLVFLPVELIDNNGDTLKNCILKYSKLWNLGSAFDEYVINQCDFCNTLVDRIVTGYVQYDNDKCAVACEPYGSFIIEASDRAKKQLPFDNIDDIKYVDSINNYRERKVKILNGTHTSSVLIAYLMGVKIVRDMMNNDLMHRFINKLLDEEIIPTIKLQKDELIDFKNSVLERFDNPFIDHKLIDISLNSVSKFEARCLPSLLGYYNEFGTAPKLLCLSIAGLIIFYKQGLANDSEDYISLIINNDIKTILSSLWSVDLTKLDGVLDLVEKYYNLLTTNDVKSAVEYAINE